MAGREALHRLVDALPEQDLPTAARVLEALSRTADAIRRAQATAPPAEDARTIARILSPRLVHPGQVADFAKEVLEIRPDAAV